MSSGNELQTSNRKSPTTVHAEPVAWNGDLMAAGRSSNRTGD